MPSQSFECLPCMVTFTAWQTICVSLSVQQQQLEGEAEDAAEAVAEAVAVGRMQWPCSILSIRTATCDPFSSGSCAFRFLQYCGSCHSTSWTEIRSDRLAFCQQRLVLFAALIQIWIAGVFWLHCLVLLCTFWGTIRVAVVQHCLPALPCPISNAYEMVGVAAVSHSIGTAGSFSSLLTCATALHF